MAVLVELPPSRLGFRLGAVETLFPEFYTDRL